MLVICTHMSDGGEKKDKEKNTDMSDGGDNFSESVSGVRSSSMILLFQESELLHLKMINIKYSNDAICWYIDDDDDEKGGEMKSPWFEERLARPPPPFHLHSVITDKLTKYIFKDSFTFSLPLAFCTFKKKLIVDTHSRKHAGPGDIPRKILRKGNVSRNHTIYKISMISESFQSPKWMNFQRFLAFDPISEKCSKFMTKGGLIFAIDWN